MNRVQHAGGHLRRAFEDVVDGSAEWVDFQPNEEVPEPWQFPRLVLDASLTEAAADEFDGDPPTRRSLLEQLRDCSDIMPSSLCDQLNMVSGSTYGEAAPAWLDALKDSG